MLNISRDYDLKALEGKVSIALKPKDGKGLLYLY